MRIHSVHLVMPEESLYCQQRGDRARSGLEQSVCTFGSDGQTDMVAARERQGNQDLRKPASLIGYVWNGMETCLILLLSSWQLCSVCSTDPITRLVALLLALLSPRIGVAMILPLLLSTIERRRTPWSFCQL